jgi:hypothetical protein
LGNLLGKPGLARRRRQRRQWSKEAISAEIAKGEEIRCQKMQLGV